MTWLLVDDADGRILDQVEDWDEAIQVLEELTREAPELADHLSLVEFGFRDGVILGASSSVTMRSLT